MARTSGYRNAVKYICRFQRILGSAMIEKHVASCIGIAEPRVRLF